MAEKFRVTGAGKYVYLNCNVLIGELVCIRLDVMTLEAIYLIFGERLYEFICNGVHNVCRQKIHGQTICRKIQDEQGGAVYGITARGLGRSCMLLERVALLCIVIISSYTNVRVFINQVMTFDDFPTVNTVIDLADGILLNEVMHAV